MPPAVILTPPLCGSRADRSACHAADKRQKSAYKLLGINEFAALAAELRQKYPQCPRGYRLLSPDIVVKKDNRTVFDVLPHRFQCAVE